jgi:hypothetical protein
MSKTVKVEDDESEKEEKWTAWQALNDASIFPSWSVVV